MSRRLEELWYADGEGQGFAERAALSPLSLASLVFGAAVGARNALYERGALPVRRVEGARVVSVGNLNVGGAGKTPAVIHLAQLARSRGRKVAVLSRGYGRASSAEHLFSGQGTLPDVAEFGDEPLLIARRCPGVTVAVGPDRAVLADRVRQEFGSELILLDDGLQHRRLARDVEIVVVDEAAGFGNGKMLPRGPLREPLAALSRADLIWLRSARSGRRPLPEFRAPVVRTEYRPAEVLAPDGEAHPAEALRGQRVLALAGLARPGSFLAMLPDLGMEVVFEALYADHHRFSRPELADLEARAAKLGARIVTTEKDGARLPEGFPAWRVRLEVKILEGEEALLGKLGL